MILFINLLTCGGVHITCSCVPESDFQVNPGNFSNASSKASSPLSINDLSFSSFSSAFKRSISSACSSAFSLNSSRSFVKDFNVSANPNLSFTPAALHYLIITSYFFASWAYSLIVSYIPFSAATAFMASSAAFLITFYSSLSVSPSFSSERPAPPALIALRSSYSLFNSFLAALAMAWFYLDSARRSLAIALNLV